MLRPEHDGLHLPGRTEHHRILRIRRSENEAHTSVSLNLQLLFNYFQDNTIFNYCMLIVLAVVLRLLGFFSLLYKTLRKSK